MPNRFPHRLVQAARVGLGATLRRLARRFSPPSVPPAPLPERASFATRSHSGPTGTRAYALYTPANRGDGPLRPLLVMLHGCTQTADDFAAGTGMNALAEAHGVFVAYPEQPASANPQKCWNWFRPEDQARDQGEPALIADLTRALLRDHPIDPSRVWVAGLSAGGSAAAILGAVYPDLYAAVGVHSGLPAGAAHDLPSALLAMRQGAEAAAPLRRAVPTFIVHGDQDRVVNPRNAEALASAVVASAPGLNGATEKDGQAPDGHAYRRALFADSNGRILCERWMIHGAGHAWIGGHPAGSYTDPQGPNVAKDMLRFFLAQRLTATPA
ncbi:esterase [Azospirillum cavernae]|uniref:Esterase n=1 Tax=Azospirillum cavernae TaxID=2320860 RepID=A0A418VPZ3_9PROT|nr:PHB depolymerase family esterase [Azospirillum cavernae]RJF78334.1 esterase [Azospirillum cavernae]